MQLLKKHIPIVVAFIMGVVMFFQFYVPTRFSNDLLTSILQWDRVIAGFAMLLGIYSLLNYHYHRLRRRTAGWGFSVIVYVGFFAMTFLGLYKGITNNPPLTIIPPVRGIVAGPDELNGYNELINLKPGDTAPAGIPDYVNSMFNAIQGLETGSPILFVLDYDQALEADLYPSTVAILRHAFNRNARVLAVTFIEGSVPILNRALAEASAGTTAQYGSSYVNLGYKQGGAAVLISGGQGLPTLIGTDYLGLPTTDMVVIKGLTPDVSPVPEPWATLEVDSLSPVAALKDFKDIVNLAGGTGVDPWVATWLTNKVVETSKVTLLVGTLPALVSGYLVSYGELYQVQEYMPFMWMYDFMFVPMQATMFSILAFYIASAAYRAFRARTREATVLLVTAIVVMLGRVPLGSTLLRHSVGGEWVTYKWIGGANDFLAGFTDWILTNPSMAAQRGIMIGIGLGVIATSLRIIFGIERTYMGGGE
jgi:hypothetical protein